MKGILEQQKCWFCPACDLQLHVPWCPGHIDQAGKSATSRGEPPLHTMHSVHAEPEIRWTGLIPCLLTDLLLRPGWTRKSREHGCYSHRAPSLGERPFLARQWVYQMWLSLPLQRGSFFLDAKMSKYSEMLMSWNIGHSHHHQKREMFS